MAEKIVVNQSGIGLGTLLTVLFVGLKLTGYIAWSWWWVFAPLWIPVVVIVGIAAILLVIYGLAKAAE